MIQAKFKAREDNKKDFNWVRNEFEKEMKKFETRKVKVEIPENYLFFTNVVLTPTAKTGGRDQIEELEIKYKSKIKNIKIFGYDDLRGFLENNRDVAVAYASFILPGDILWLLYCQENFAWHECHVCHSILEFQERANIFSHLLSSFPSVSSVAKLISW